MKDPKRFVDDFYASHSVVEQVAEFWRGRGLTVTVPEQYLGPREEWYKYMDGGDLKIPNRERDIIQVKGRGNIRFTGAHDYPYDTVFIDEHYKIIKHFDKLESYCIVSKDRRKLCVISWETHPEWLEIERLDRIQNRKCLFVACPKQFCEWHDLETA